MRNLRVRNPSGDFLFPSSETAIERSSRDSAKVVDAKGYYARLGLDYGSSERDIKQRGRELMLQCHPDHGGDVEEFYRIHEALAVLLDNETRDVYDALTPFDVFLSVDDMSGLITKARIAGDERTEQEILQDHGVILKTHEPSNGRLSWYEEDGLATDEESMSEWRDMLLGAAREIGWSAVIRVGVARLGSRFEIEWRCGEPIFLLGAGICPTKQDAESAVAYASMVMLSRMKGR